MSNPKRLSSAEFDQQVLGAVDTKRLTLSEPLVQSTSSSSLSSNPDSYQEELQRLSPTAEHPETEPAGKSPSGTTLSSPDSATRHAQEEQRINSSSNASSLKRASVSSSRQRDLAPADQASRDSLANNKPVSGSAQGGSAGMNSNPAEHTTATVEAGPIASTSKLPASESDSTFSRTMRKTSGFFRKRFGTQSQHNTAGKPMYSTSNRSTPSHAATLRAKGGATSPPPVPSLPPKASTLDRRRSTSISHVPASALSRPGTQSSLNSDGAASKSDEDERLNRVLRSVDWDGLAEKLDRPPSPKRAATAKPALETSGTASTPDPTPDSSAKPESLAGSETTVSAPKAPRTTRSSSLPPTLSPSEQQANSTPRRASAQSSPPTDSKSLGPPASVVKDDEVHTPSIRLVPSQQSLSNSPPTRHSSLPAQAQHIQRSDDSSPSPNKGSPRLGLGLDPISENGQSKESLLSNHTTRAASRSASHGSSKSQDEFQTGIPDSISPSSIRTPLNYRQSLAQSSLSPARASTSSLQRTLSPSSQNLSEEELETRGIEAGQKCWDQDESFIKKHKIAEFLGSGDALSEVARRQYMSNFDLSGLRLDAAFRKLCDKLYLKAETQQVDRILEHFSKKYYEDNSDCVLPSPDTVHQVVYSVLLLNTDLHVADVNSHMSSKQFVKNTMSTIQSHVGSSPQQSSPQLPQIARIKSREPMVASPVTSPTEEVDEPPVTRPPLEHVRERVSSNTIGGRLQRAGSVASHHSTDLTHVSPVRSKSTPMPASKIWDNEIEALLRDMYADIKNNPIYLPGVSSTNLGVGHPLRNANRRSQISLGSSGGSGVAGKRSSVRGFLGHPSTDSFRASSPTPSTITSFSDGNSTALGSSTATSLMTPPQTIGFASNLKHTIIKEQHENEDAPDDSREEAASDSGVSATDEELALMGAPWAKEGLLQRKHYWESQNRRAKDKNWGQVFVVISKGDFRMFKFGDLSKGTSRGAGGFGGGNWLANAEDVGDISMAHSLTCAMPPPGYSRSRPHVFVMTLASNSSFFFQAGTDELVQEWVATCNYWAARLSREPLTGGVSNMDFGWNRVLPSIPSAGEDGEEELDDARSVRSGKSNKSARSTRSGRSRFSTRNNHFGHLAAPGGSVNPNDRVVIAEWKPPQQPTTGSALSEEEQLKSLRRYCGVLQADLETHNELRAPMIRLYSSKSPNAAKSNTNWEKKSSFLLAEIVKYTTYISALEEAIRLRSEKSANKAMDKTLKTADVDDAVAVESLAALEGRRGPMLHQGPEAGSFVDVTAPAPLMGDAPVAGMRRHKRASTQSCISYVESEYHDSQSLAHTQSSAPSASDPLSPRQSVDTYY